MSIINTYDQMKAFGGDRIAICYTGWGGSRDIQSPCWRVCRLLNGKEMATDPKSAWYDGQKKTFLLGFGPVREMKPIALKQTIEWANEEYGDRGFVRNRLGDFVEKEVNKRFPIGKRNSTLSDIPSPTPR